jgi:hypothetical protein
MACNSCGSVNQGEFRSETDIHFPGLENANKRPIVLFPEMVVCQNCGRAEFTVPEDELALLTQHDAIESQMVRPTRNAAPHQPKSRKPRQLDRALGEVSIAPVRAASKIGT